MVLVLEEMGVMEKQELAEAVGWRRRLGRRLRRVGAAMARLCRSLGLETRTLAPVPGSLRTW